MDSCILVTRKTLVHMDKETSLHKHYGVQMKLVKPNKYFYERKCCASKDFFDFGQLKMPFKVIFIVKHH